MPNRWLCIFVMSAGLTPLWADWKITTAETGDCAGESLRTEYYKGNLRRVDVMNDGAHPLTIIVDQDSARETMWDASSKEYTSISTTSIPRQSLFLKPSPEPQPVLHIETNTIDTGESQTMFGRAARHLITTEKRWNEQTPASVVKVDFETVTDGWYVDAVGIPAEKHAGKVYLLAFNGQIPVVKRSHTGVALSGFALRETVTSRVPGRFNREHVTEVKELQESTLSSVLFAPPEDFRRVDQLSNMSFACKPTLSDEIETYWNSFSNWLLNWFS